jgi:hypothetical protein
VRALHELHPGALEPRVADPFDFERHALAHRAQQVGGEELSRDLARAHEDAHGARLAIS